MPHASGAITSAALFIARVKLRVYPRQYCEILKPASLDNSRKKIRTFY